MDESKPLYVLHQKKSRAIVPKIITLIGLGVIFYLGILLNIALLELNATHETLAKLIALGFIVVIIILGITIGLHQANLPIIFYSHYVYFNKKKLPYLNVINTTPKRGIFDKYFHTYSISPGNNIHLRNIPNEINVEDYLKQLISYAQRVAGQAQFQGQQ